MIAILKANAIFGGVWSPRPTAKSSSRQDDTTKIFKSCKIKSPSLVNLSNAIDISAAKANWRIGEVRTNLVLSEITLG